MGNLFENVDPDDIVIDPEKDYFVELVGEGKKYKDSTAAGRALAEKDAHIARIERENKDYRDRVKSTQTLEEIVNQLREQRSQEPAHQNNGTNQEPHLETPAFTKEDLEALFEERLTKRDSERVERENLATVMSLAEKALGPNFQRELEKRRQDLGLGPDFLTSVAKSNPKAFAKIMGLDEKKENSLFAPPATERNTASSVGGTKRNYKWYQELRKKDHRAYEASVQQMHKDAHEQGEAFYS